MYSMTEQPYYRPTWDSYFMEIMDTVSKRATCGRGRSGCVIAKDNQLLVSGYVGSPKRLPHCDEVGHQMKKVIHVDEENQVTEHCVRTVHAEQNAICQAAQRGIAISGATLYCRMTPCRVCAMLIINCGIIRVVAERKYPSGTESEEMLATAGVKLEYIHDEIQSYEK
jgi:dCMP deaminase